jgi:hypothetical protein
VAVHGDVFVGGTYRGANVVNHDLPLRRAYVFNNTVYGMPQGIAVVGGPLEDSLMSGNLVFAATPITAPVQQDNIVDTVANAGAYVVAPSLTLGSMNFFPRPGMVRGAPLDVSKYRGYSHHDRDFNGHAKDLVRFRGAYAGEGANPGWALDDTRKPNWPPVSRHRAHAACDSSGARSCALPPRWVSCRCGRRAWPPACGNRRNPGSRAGPRTWPPRRRPTAARVSPAVTGAPASVWNPRSTR